MAVALAVGVEEAVGGLEAEMDTVAVLVGEVPKVTEPVAVEEAVAEELPVPVWEEEGVALGVGCV